MVLSMWDGHSCPSPLTLLCHLEEADSHAKRATPDEEPALSEPEGNLLLTLFPNPTIPVILSEA